MSNQDPYAQDPYGQQPQNPYGQQPQYGMPPAPYGQGAPGQPHDPKAMPPAQPYGGFPYAVPPKHPSATTAMVLGLVGLCGAFVACGLTLVLSPFAWAVGSKAVREIDASQGRVSGRDHANIGRITGIIGTVLLVLGVLAIVAFLVFAVAVSNDPTMGYETSYYEDI